MNIEVMVFILVDDTCQESTENKIKMISINGEEIKNFKERNDEYNVWKILSYNL